MAENNPAVLLDKTFKTPKGDLRLYLDIFEMQEGIEKYTEKLMLARKLAFDVDNLSPADPKVIEASQVFTWIEDPKEIVDLARNYYRRQIAKARSHAAILEATRRNPAFKFDPEPYPPQEIEDWDVDMSEPEYNLLNPLERRLKQVFDVIASSAIVMAEFYATMETVYVEAERRARAANTDADGFRA